MAGPKPEPRLLKNAVDAEEAACEWLRYFGFDDATTTPPGTDGGVDIVGRQIVAQVKAEMKPTGRPVVQQLHGVATVEEKRAAFFALAGFTPVAVAWANKADMALFGFDLTGEPKPVNAAGRKMAAPPQPEPPRPEPSRPRPPAPVTIATGSSPGQKWKAVAPAAVWGIVPPAVFDYTAELRLHFRDCSFALFISQESVRVGKPSDDPLGEPPDMGTFIGTLESEGLAEAVTQSYANGRVPNAGRHLVGAAEIPNWLAAKILRSPRKDAAAALGKALWLTDGDKGDLMAIASFWNAMLLEEFLPACIALVRKHSKGR